MGDQSPKRLSQHKVKFRHPEQDPIFDIRTSTTSANAQRKNFFESKDLSIGQY